jgi:hypothetical protein
MVHAMGPNDPSEDPQAQKKRHRQAPVAEPVVDDEVAESEGAHAHARAEGELACHARFSHAAREDERDRQRRVKQREGIVRLEPRLGRAGFLRRVVRTVNRPKNAVPDPPVKERGPQVHGDGDDERHGHPDEPACERRVEDHTASLCGAVA